MKDFDRWRSGLAGRPNATFHSYSDLNHLLFQLRGRACLWNIKFQRTFPKPVIDDIAAWITAAKR